METDAHQQGQRRRIHVPVWVSPLTAIVISGPYWLYYVSREGVRGDRPPAVLALYIAITVFGLFGIVAGLLSVCSVRSRHDALAIIPGAILSVFANGYYASVGALSYMLEGRNLGG